jgi:hypothetical protein
MKSIKHEKGQTIIILAFAIVVLVGFAALAIDGGRVLSDKRHAQNAADTSALAAALSRVQGGDYILAGENRADSNGYNNDTNSTVEVHLCSDTGIVCQGLKANAIPSEYVHVKITSIVPTTFARVLGRNQVTNIVEAVAKASPPKFDTWFDGKALVSTMMGCKGGAPNNNNPFTVGGNGTTIVNNSGIFVNSSCSVAFVDNGTSNLVTTDEGVCVVGGIAAGVDGVSPAPVGGCGTQVDINKYDVPNLESSCPDAGSITGPSGNYDAWPGYFNKTGNKTFPDVSPSGVLKLHKGIYCLYNGISLNAGWEITTDLNGNGVHDSDSEGVIFYIAGGDVTLNGGATITVNAISSSDYPAGVRNNLIIVPMSNPANLTITGSSGSNFTGTILAPAAHCTLDGSGNTISLDTQFICYDTTITGAGYLDITYNQANNSVAIEKPNIEITK